MFYRDYMPSGADEDDPDAFEDYRFTTPQLRRIAAAGTGIPVMDEVIADELARRDRTREARAEAFRQAALS